MTYSIIDFRCIVAKWFNEFLPNEVEKKSIFVKEADVIYVKPFNFDAKFKRRSLRFLKDVVDEMVGAKIGIVVEEPKPVNNINLHPLLKHVESSHGISEENKVKVLHISNRRYLPTSSSVIISQAKEIDELLSDMFDKMASSNPRFLKLTSLGIHDMMDVARSFFPKSALEFQVNPIDGGLIDVLSANDSLMGLNAKIMHGKSSNDVIGFLPKCKLSLKQEFERII